MDRDNRPSFSTACALAGGRGRRKARRDKLLMEIAGERLLVRITRHLHSRLDDLLAVTSRPEAFEGLDFRVAPDAVTDGGPLGGLLSGLKSARSRWVHLVACDMPLFSEPWVAALEWQAQAIDEAGRSLPPSRPRMARISNPSTRSTISVSQAP